MFDLLDEIWGMFNFIPAVAGAVRTAFWRSQARNSRQYSKWQVVQFSFQRKDKGGKYDVGEVIAHLNRYGVAVVAWNYDSKRWYVTVRKNQEQWARKLLGNASGGKLFTPRKGWND